MLRMIGVDLVHIPEFDHQLTQGGSTFLEKVFHVSELKNMRADHLAGLWAAKEAVIKAADTEPKHYTDIRLSADARGKMQAQYRNHTFEISIAHHGEYAVAVALRLP
jgi:phosphopantetheine--protein transferase-like protein